MEDLAPLPKEAIAEKVVKHVLGLVREGVLAPGQKLPSERDLAASMGVSRPSLREALRALSLLGILEIRQGEGVFVSELTPDALLEPLQFFLSLNGQSLDTLFEARIAVEAGIAEIAARKIDETALGHLRACMARGNRAQRRHEEFLAVDEEFHGIIVAATGNPFLSRVANSFQELGKASRKITVTLPGVTQQSHADHAQIMEALEGHDPQAARESMTSHLRNVQAALHLSRLSK